MADHEPPRASESLSRAPVRFLMSVTLDFVQEYRAGQAAERLRHSVVVREQVLRDGKLLEIPLAGMVPRVLRATGEFETNEVSVLYRGVDGT